ncbi:hypothetical protein ACG92U_04285 [Leuconostoc citreum]
MINELAQPKVDVKDGQINFKNVNQFKSDFEQIIQRNSNFIVTDETLTGSKKPEQNYVMRQKSQQHGVAKSRQSY